MNKYIKNYGIQETNSIKEYHKSRIMFCIKDDKLYIAEKGLDYSHAVWFEKLGWTNDTNHEQIMNTIIRGVVDKDLNIAFFYGYDFQIDEKSEKIMLKHLKQLTKQIKLNPESELIGGYIKQVGITIWQPRKKYGLVKQFI